MFLFETPIKEKEVRKNCTAYKMKNGCIIIQEYDNYYNLIRKQKYFLYSMTEAIAKYRRDFSKRNKK